MATTTLSPTEIARLPHARKRHYGRWISTLIVLFILGSIIEAFADGQIEWRVVGQFFTAKAILDGLVNTIIMTICAMVFGIVLGIILGTSRIINAGSQPLLVGFNAIPKVAVVPILILWFGVGWIPPVLTAFLISFFPIVVNVATGLATIEPELEDVLKALGASKFDIMRKVGIPRALPYLFGSLKVAITLAFVGTVVSETLGANAGLGYMIALEGASFRMANVYAALLLLAFEGVLMYALFAWIEQYFTRWAFRSQMSAAG